MATAKTKTQNYSTARLKTKYIGSLFSILTLDMNLLLFLTEIPEWRVLHLKVEIQHFCIMQNT